MKAINFIKRSFASDFKSSFAQRATSNRSLNEFYKYTHPDMFGAAPAAIRDSNQKSIQQLNAYMQALKSNQTVDGATLKFFVRPDEKKEEFTSFDVSLDSVRGSSELHKSHKEATVVRLVTSLENALFDAEHEGPQKFAREQGMAEFATDIENDWEHEMKSPLKDKQRFAQIQEEFYYN